MVYEDFQELRKCFNSFRILDEINLINKELKELNNDSRNIPKLVDKIILAYEKISGEYNPSNIRNENNKELMIIECQKKLDIQINYLKNYKTRLFNEIEIIQRNSY